ncbi:DUF6602 domain-containing protein [Kocuria rhizophila]|uniref:DUF6602 domain-containing protein n=1 Tax=Kocuria rhizophila TaxID=72000 RepID=UPI00387A30BA
MHYANADSMRRANSTSIKDLLENAEVLRDLILKDNKDPLGHTGEDGKWTESLIAQYLRSNLPTDLEVSTGFVVDLKSERRSYQVDILVHDSSAFPPILRYGDAVIISPAAVVAAISVKFKITRANLKKEILELADIGNLCGGKPDTISPYLGLIGFAFEDPKMKTISKFSSFSENIPKKFVEIYKTLGDTPHPGQKKHRRRKISGNEVVDSLIVLEGFILHAASRDINNLEANRDVIRLTWGGPSGNYSYALGLELIRGVLEHWPRNRVRRAQWPAASGMGMQKAGTIPIVAENRPTVADS